MPETPSHSCAENISKAIHAFQLTGLRSQAYLQGEEWTRSRIADLKIDLHLSTEYGEGEQMLQVDDIHHRIETLESVLRPSPFDPAPSECGNLSLQSAAAELAEYSLSIAKKSLGNTGDTFANVLAQAKRFLETRAGRDEAYKCMNKVLNDEGVLFEDVQEVVDRAGKMLDACGF